MLMKFRKNAFGMILMDLRIRIERGTNCSVTFFGFGILVPADAQCSMRQHWKQ
jgi:hypothetical protein